MLKKLFCHEWKAVTKILLLIHCALLAFAFIGRVFFSLTANPFNDATFTVDDTTGIIVTFYFIFYALGILVIASSCYFLLAGRFYKNLFTDEGYLMNTLPVSVDIHIWSKFLVFFLWTIIDFIAIVLSVAILVVTPENWVELLDGIQEMLAVLLSNISQREIIQILYPPFSALISFFFYIFMTYFSITLGSLWKTHKIIGSVVSFMVLYVIVQIINSIILIYVNWSPFSSRTSLGTTYVSNSLFGSIIVTLIGSVLCYLGTRFIMTRKLNLD